MELVYRCLEQVVTGRDFLVGTMCCFFNCYVAKTITVVRAKLFCMKGPGDASGITLGMWSKWVSRTNSHRRGDFEQLSAVRNKFPSVCPYPIAAECRTRLRADQQQVSYEKTGDKLRVACTPNEGLVCDNADQNGTTCSDYEIRFFCPPDVDECKKNPCDDTSKCVNTHGSYVCRCKGGFKLNRKNAGKKGGGKKCGKTRGCMAWGDPHYSTFDGKRIHFMGICKYKLVTLCPRGNNSLTNFTVKVKNEYRGLKSEQKGVSYTRYVEIDVHGQSVRLLKGFKVTVDTVAQEIPYKYSKKDGSFINIEMATGKVVLTTDFGLVVSFDGDHRAEVDVDDAFKGQVCGLCGNYDGNLDNDLQLPDGSLAKSHNQFGNAWADLVSEPGCRGVAKGISTCTNDYDRDKARTECQKLTDRNGPFAGCHALLDPAGFVASCIVDVCLNPKEPDLLCNNFDTYAKACGELLGRPINWRSPTLCAPVCKEREMYVPDGPGCQATCLQPDAAAQCELGETAGCFCKPEYPLRSGSSCVRPEHCGCVDDGKYRKVGEVWYKDQCRTFCECLDAGEKVCHSNYACHTNAICKTQASGEEACVCLKGFEGERNDCKDVDECTKMLHRCSDNALCKNVHGSYTCKCKDGFTGDGYKCEDINECNFKPCDQHATCHNEHGSFQCVCDSGYQGNGIYCSEIVLQRNTSQVKDADCSFWQQFCVQEATCVRLGPKDKFSCKCRPGMQGDGKKGRQHTGCRYPDCPSGMRRHEDACYRPVSQPHVSVKEAREACQARGGELAAIKDQDTMDFLNNLALTYGQKGLFFIGLNDRRFEGFHVWADNTASDFSKWDPVHPNTADKDCVVADVGRSVLFRAFRCTDRADGYICKTPLWRPPCPAGWTHKEKSGCYFKSKQPTDYYNAYIRCTLQGGDLISVASLQEMKKLQLTLMSKDGKQSYWTGLQQGFLGSIGKGFSWPDGTLLDPKIAEKFTNFNRLGDYCVKFDSRGSFEAVNCTERNRFICKKPENSEKTCPGEETMRFGNSCYKMKPYDRMPRHDARDVCRRLGGNLVVIRSATEQLFVKDYIKRQMWETDYWIGLRELRTNGNYSWVDGTPYGFAVWAPGNPDDKTAFNCVRMRKNANYAWDDASCELSISYICQFRNTPCKKDRDCHSKGFCSYDQCRCKVGYQGDGKHSCDDINECDENVCFGANSKCHNTEGSFHCDCAPGTIKVGKFCVPKGACKGNQDCHSNGFCNEKKLCQCKKGYAGDGLGICNNIDECQLGTHDCHSYAICTDREGYFSCTCQTGYHGDGKKCSNIPLDCHDILRKDSAASSGPYEIDPDGAGGSPAFKVQCEMRAGIGITVVPHNAEKPRTVRNRPKPESYRVALKYKTASIPELLPLITRSTFCYQEMRFSCQKATKLQASWFDGKGRKYTNWAGSTESGQCACGVIGVCNNPNNQCNCDGDTETKIAWSYDNGKFIDKSVLPIRQYHLGGIGRTQKVKISVGPLKCGPKQFDIPKDCDDAKRNFGVKQNGPVWIDLDGPDGDQDGNLEPFLAYCDVESHPHVGVTEIPNDNGRNPGPPSTGPPGTGTPAPGPPGTGPTGPPGTGTGVGPPGKGTTPGTGPPGTTTGPSKPGPPDSPEGPKGPQTPKGPGVYPVRYPVRIEIIQKLIKVSMFCSQSLEYQCENSRLLADGAMYGYWSRLDGLQMKYWAGGMRQEHMCGCGITKSCDVATKKCNCDIQDGVRRKDFGVITDKGDLPVGSITVQDIGGDRQANFTVGSLKCAPNQFGIEPTCQQYRMKKNLDTYTYLIDPDGPVNPKSSTKAQEKNLPPFPVVCEMFPDMPVGVTVIGHDTEKPTPVQGSEGPGSYSKPVDYTEAELPQVVSLVDRSGYCHQKLTYQCRNSAIHLNGVQFAFWKSRGNSKKKLYYLAGKGGDKNDTCGCGLDSTCDGGPKAKCNCDQKTKSWKKDEGWLGRKEDLPVTSLHFGDTGDKDERGKHTLGKLRCYEIFPTCHHLKKNYKWVLGQKALKNGVYVIDPDEAQGVDPFEVHCEFPHLTVLVPKEGADVRVNTTSANITNPLNYERPHANCTVIKYEEANTEQMRVLTEVSGFCSQYGAFECQHAPFTSHAYWEDREGQKREGWAGNAGGKECACGMTNRCHGGVDVRCNCDNNDKVLRKDHGLFVDKSVLPVSQVCYGLSDVPVPSKQHKFVGYQVEPLKCGPWQFGIHPHCQRLRDKGMTTTQTWLIDPDGKRKDGVKPFPVHCDMTKEPPLGVSVVTHDNEGCKDIKPGGGDTKYKYNAVTVEQVESLTNVSVYCTQDMSYKCTKAALDLTKKYGWYNIRGEKMADWAGSMGKRGCLQGKCKCNGKDGNEHVDGGSLLDKSELPVTKVSLGAVSKTGKRCLKTKPLRCFATWRNCEEIRVADVMYNANKNNRYAIDSDGAGGIEVFGATCDFKTDKSMGITVIPHKNTGLKKLPKSPKPAGGEVRVDYRDASPEQANVLAQISGFCSQEVQYQCKNIPLINDNKPAYAAYVSFDGKTLPHWAGADRVANLTGCSCQLLGTCPKNHTCRCDARSKDTISEGGLVTNRDMLPLSKIKIGGSTSSSKAGIAVGSLACAPKPFGLPQDCEKAKKMGYKTGETLIWPNKKLDPFLVYCDMNSKLNPDRGITMICPSLSQDIPATGSIPLTYHQATLKQVTALVGQSRYCYMPAKLSCFATNFLDGYYFKTHRGSKRSYFGYGSNSKKTCSCGEDKRCGGLDGKKAQASRACNCGVGDEAWRYDAGSFQSRPDLPIKEFFFPTFSKANASATILLGCLYCADKDIDLDECAMGFHDCDPNAECINKPRKYECRCKRGYHGIGDTTRVSNGRQCIDNDECYQNKCPGTATCENTFGSFICHCKPGFRKTGPTTCVDINECTEGNHTCDGHARCINNKGSYSCRCKDGYRGNGQKGQCIEVGTCKCWGDPHCLSFDRKWLHFQGSCKYTLVRDGCGNGMVASKAPTFEVIQKNWRGFKRGTKRKVSWVKELTIKIYNMTIELKQKNKVFVEGLYIKRLPWRGNKDTVVRRRGSYVIVTAINGVIVKWNGRTEVQVSVPSAMKNKLCGLCGNYNKLSRDDWTLGPKCKDPSGATTTSNYNTFGHSWTSDEPDSDPQCEKPKCDDPMEEICKGDEIIEAKRQCAVLTDFNGRFKECLKEMSLSSMDEIQQINQSCITDMCATEDNIELALCEQAEALASHCAENMNIAITNWRDSNFCGTTECKESMQYDYCVSPAQLTCASNKMTTNVSRGLTPEGCMEGCACKKGYMVDGDKCVKKKECGCVDMGTYYSIGDRMVRPNCSEECYCKKPMGSLDCQVIKCHADAKCERQGGIQDCYCSQGYMGNGRNCTDVDECSKSPGPCDKNAACKNTKGSYNCSCNSGYRGNGTTCKDINECMEGDDDCDRNAVCKNKPGSYECECKVGYRMNSSNICEDIKECKSGRNNCHKRSTTCSNLPGTYECLCQKGFTRKTPKRCQDIDECKDAASNNCSTDASCENSYGGYSCSCKPGYNGTGEVCNDYDECSHEDWNECSDNANCSNTIGSYKCSCHQGYKGDGKNCEDKNECKDGTADDVCVPAAEGGKCKNKPGTFKCACRNGYVGDGLSNGTGCTDVDECSNAGPPVCGPNAVCTNRPPGSYTCSCKDGFRRPSKNKICEKIPTCKDGDLICGVNEVCTQSPTGDSCRCKEGFMRGSAGACEDINECKTGKPKCQGEKQLCVNTEGTYKCDCLQGYHMNAQGKCRDIDECEEGNYTCMPNSKCKNREGSYTCKCDKGFVMKTDKNNKKRCKDVDECRDQSHSCHEKANCKNTEGSYSCTCKDGYFGNGRTCSEKSDCFKDGRECDFNAVCEGKPKRCVCVTGYEGDGYNCTNIDECERKVHDCTKNAKCVDEAGGFRCECKRGYSGHCDECKDVDECATGLNNCPHHSTCINVEGSFKCVCKKGFSGDGSQCQDNNECELGMHKCDQLSTCVNTIGSYYCMCDMGFKRVGKTSCQDIDECKTGNFRCDTNAKCINIPGSYDCICRKGYYGDGKTCTTDHPRQCGNATCDTLATCVDVGKGEKECVCPQNYVGLGYTEKGKPGCKAIDPCGFQQCGFNQDCYPVDGVAVCRCKQGYQQTGKVCQKVNPCKQLDVCGKGASCLANNNSYACVCKEGYALVEKHCDDINECELKIAKCPDNSHCYNTKGSYKCQCVNGYAMDEGSNTCKDINECKRGKSDCDTPERATCTNTEGSFTCSCREGFTGDGKTCNALPPLECTKSCGQKEHCRFVSVNGKFVKKCKCNDGYAPSTINNQTKCEDTRNCEPGSCPKEANCVEKDPGFNCVCKEPGYVKQGKDCVDVNECKLQQFDCDQKADCINTPGSYRCHCRRGYRGNGKYCALIPPSEDICKCGINGICDAERDYCYCKSGYVFVSSRKTDRCQDDDSCRLPGVCHPLATCKDLKGGYSCKCPKGYSGNGKAYCDEDECKTGKARCSPWAKCHNIPGTYSCVCKPGYTGDGFTCTKIKDPCGKKKDGCGQFAKCVSKDGQKECRCLAGYKGDGEKCVDINECLETSDKKHTCHPNADCFNYHGNYYCKCKQGYRGTGHFCIDVDECAEKKDNCSPFADCQNQVGGYRCICKTGYWGDGKQCIPMGACAKDGGCHQDAACVRKKGKYSCECKNGFRGNGQICFNKNECKDGTATCHKHANCTDLPGGYKCTCQHGFSGNGFFCQDIDECAPPRKKDCGPNARCVNKPGSYKCDCFNGFKLEGDRCKDIDECKKDEWNKCSKNATCDNTAGAYTCTCKEGFTGNGVLCDDVNECKLGIANCHKNSLCKNEPGKFTCECLRGYVGDGKNCTDEDECKDEQMNDCDKNAECENNEGSYKCTCKEGYRGNGRICIKPNPCDKLGACHQNATCNFVNKTKVCKCMEPLEGDGVEKCESTDECAKGKHDCDKNAECIDTDEGYECKCKKGFQGDGKNCTDINECDPSSPGGGSNNCDATNGGGCQNSPPASFTCTCPKGSKLNSDNKCDDTNECKTGEASCSENADCKDKIGGFICKCKPGYEGDGKNCTDIDECEKGIHTCPSTAVCNNTEGSFKCDCKKGFRMSTAKQKCIDINECKEVPDSCDTDAVCTNTKGSYSCTCKPGYTGDGKNCTDIDECETKTDPCHDYAKCINVPGSCKCLCQNGFTGDGIHCEEIDQCGPNAPHKCANTSYCVSKNKQVDKFICACKSGYKANGKRKCKGNTCQEVCEDKNECNNKKKKCSPFASCNNTQGGFKCTCRPGYFGWGKTCEDIDECALGIAACDAKNGICDNSGGSFKCRCAEGYTLQADRRTCLQHDECKTGNHGCSSEAKCIDTDGSYSCQCKDGYKGDGKICEDVNECLTGQDDCHPKADCINEPGTYKCKCKDGYRGNGRSCTDIDECAKPGNVCGPNATCINLAGSFFCRCKEGFKLVDKQCLDIDECTEGDGQKKCEKKNAICKNRLGGYDCVCPKGYKKNLKEECEDKNECATGKRGTEGICGANGACKNTLGSCICACKPGYQTPVGETCGRCTDVNECVSKTNPHNCPGDSVCANKSPGFKCKCKSGFRGTPGSCKDVDECKKSAAEKKSVCGVGTCNNTRGAYLCLCPHGYRFSDGTCQNVNECKEPVGSKFAAECLDADCEDTVGSYRCVCKEGFLKAEDKTCVDKDECLSPNQCGKRGKCVNTPGSYHCDCDKGFFWNGKECEDFNECRVLPLVCGEPSAGTCQNTGGSFQCNCNPGYQLQDGKCVDINECKNNTNMCRQFAHCINELGTYRCECAPGYKEEDGVCQNVDECIAGPHTCDVNAECNDTIGSYKCTCKPGWVGDGHICNAACGPGVCPEKKSCRLGKDNEPICECRCTVDDCQNRGRVCGSDGVEYRSDRELILTSCREGRDIKRSYRGRCKDTCDEITCSVGQVCKMVQGKAVCKCPKCTKGDRNSGLVCTDRGETELSRCFFIHRKCVLQLPYGIKHRGPCKQEECKYSKWTPFSRCSVTCGEGKQIRTRRVVKNSSKGCPDTKETRRCHSGTCKGDACEKHVCTRWESYCVEEGGVAICKCPDCTGQPQEKVCGRVATYPGGRLDRKVTARNLCMLKQQACVHNREMEYLHKGHCNDKGPDKPAACTVQPHYDVAFNDQGCQTNRKVQVNKCVGGCGKKVGKCCDGIKFDTKRQSFICKDGKVVSSVVKTITKCGCVPDKRKSKSAANGGEQAKKEALETEKIKTEEQPMLID